MGFPGYFIGQVDQIGKTSIKPYKSERFKLGFNQQRGVVFARLALAKPPEELARSYPAG
jgi:hypothetical protein